jgi:hypothetical protein
MLPLRTQSPTAVDTAVRSPAWEEGILKDEERLPQTGKLVSKPSFDCLIEMAHKGGVRIGKTPKKLASICCP